MPSQVALREIEAAYPLTIAIPCCASQSSSSSSMTRFTSGNCMSCSNAYFPAMLLACVVIAPTSHKPTAAITTVEIAMMGL